MPLKDAERVASAPLPTCSWGASTVSLWNGDRLQHYALGDAYNYPNRNSHDEKNRTLLWSMARQFPGTIIADYWAAVNMKTGPEVYSAGKGLQTHGPMHLADLARVVAARLGLNSTHATESRAIASGVASDTSELAIHLRVGDGIILAHMTDAELISLCHMLRGHHHVTMPWTSIGLRSRNCSRVTLEPGLYNFVIAHAEKNSGAANSFTPEQIASAVCAYRLSYSHAIKSVRLVAGVHGRWHPLLRPTGSFDDQRLRLLQISCDLLKETARQVAALGLSVALESGLPDEDLLTLTRARHLMFQQGSGFSRVAQAVRTVVWSRHGGGGAPPPRSIERTLASLREFRNQTNNCSPRSLHSHPSRLSPLPISSQRRWRARAPREGRRRRAQAAPARA